MRHRKGGSKLGRNPSHRRATLRNLVTNVIERERIHTTLARARAARPLVEQMITLGKRDSLHTRRQAAAFLLSPSAVKRLFAEIGPRFSDRPGGYTRIVRAGFRHGDNAEAAILELVGSEMKVKEKKAKKETAEEAEGEEEKEWGKLPTWFLSSSGRLRPSATGPFVF
ncbi:MAG: 50S ribosomal protein L17 [Acidobacteriota bacterium]|nr:50S ribosomal protein L17 [Acidobacteriota bacterium]